MLEQIQKLTYTQFTPTKELLSQCGWLSVNQLITYHGLVMVYKMIVSKKPVSMHEKMTKNEHSYNTRMWVHVKDGKDGPLYGGTSLFGDW